MRSSCSMRRLRIYLFFAILLVSVGCNSELRVGTVQVGRSLNADNTVAHSTTTFKPDETVYVSVHTVGSAPGTLGVRWLYEGRVMGEPTKKISYRGAAATEVHLQNAGGFPPGDYAVEIMLNGQSVETRKFRVDKQ